MFAELERVGKIRMLLFKFRGVDRKEYAAAVKGGY